MPRRSEVAPQLETELRRAVRRGRECRVTTSPHRSRSRTVASRLRGARPLQHPQRGLSSRTLHPARRRHRASRSHRPWVLEEACRQTRSGGRSVSPTPEPKTLRQRQPSGRQSRRPTVASIAGALRDTKFDPTSLRLETPESVNHGARRIHRTRCSTSCARSASNSPSTTRHRYPP